MDLAVSRFRPDILIADIGGTTSRLALMGADGRPDRTLIVSNDALSCAEEAIGHYLDKCGARPDAAVLAVAGPIDGDMVALTNRPWRFSLEALAGQFGFSRVKAINDFEAVAWALAKLRPDDTWPLHPPHCVAREHGTKVVFGPGSGLGVAALVPAGKGFGVIASEGGHVSFGPAGREEEIVFARLRALGGPVSAETVLSGPGLERLYAALHPDREPLSAEAVVSAMASGDPSARAAGTMFVSLLGRFAGDLALMFKATGGIYIAGGVAQRLRRFIDAKAFRAAFEAHPPYQTLLAGIPTMLVTLEEPGLLGCAAIAERFAGELSAV